MTVFTVDVSNHDYDRGALNWQSVRGAGIEVAIAKASEGDPGGYHYTDPDFITSVTNARLAGLRLMGGYHCLAAGDSNSIARQVDYLIQRMDQVGGASKGWAMLDVEPFPELKNRGMAPRIQDVIAFERLWHTKTGRTIAHYIPNWYWHELGSPSLTGISGPLVSSNYPIAAHQPYVTLYSHAGGDTGPGWASYGGKSVTLWQYGSSASIPGIAGNADCNAYRGTYDQLIQVLTGTHAVPAYPPWPGRVLVNETPLMHGSDVKQWQSKMAARGWTIAADGFYGNQSEQVCRQFQTEKHLVVDGKVGEVTWTATWTSPITN